MIFPQYKHQAEEYREHRYDRARALFWQMRTGKSKAIIDNACCLIQEDKLDGVLILAPNGVHLNWVMRELPAHHWTGDYAAMAWRFSSPTVEQEFVDFIDEAAMKEGWLALNLSSMTRAEVKRAVARFERVCPRFMLVADESHHFRRPGAKRTARARSIARRAAYRRILSGSSLDNCVLHAFSQFELLEKEALGFSRYDDFKDHFARFKMLRNRRTKRQYEKLDSYRNLDELKLAMSKYASVVLRTDCEDLPPVIPDQRLVEMSDEQVRLYRAIVKTNLDVLEEYDIYDPLDGGAQLNKLQQITSGFMYRDDGSVLQLPNPKMEALLEEIRMHDGKVIVWCRFTHDILSVARELAREGITSTQYHGKMSQNVREAGLRAFQDEEEPRVLIGQPQAGGEGRDMSAASKIVWFSHTPDNIVRTQADERATKVGGEPVQLVDLVVPGSVDTYYLELLSGKRSVADDVSRHGLRAVLEKVKI